MRSKLRSLISSVESLGLDTQPIRDLLASNYVNLEDYANKVNNLEREIPRHPPGSQPQHVQILISSLRPVPKEAKFQSKNVHLKADNYVIQKNETKLDQDLVNTIQKLGLLADHLSKQPSTPAPTHSDKNSDLLLEKLEQLGEKVDNIKAVKGSQIQTDIDEDFPTMEEGFVNPLDEKEVKKLTGKVHVVPKKGRSLASSLKKLRDLKK